MSTSPLSFAPPVTAGPSLAQRFREVRQRTELLCAPLLPEDTVVQPMLDVSPPKWHLAHVTWFWETFLLKEHLPGYSVFHPDYAFLFNSYYNSLGSRVNRADRGTISRPALTDVYAYRAHIDQHMPQLLALADTLPSAFHEVFELGLQHEQQHQELLATDIKYILSTSPLAPAYFTNSELGIRNSESRKTKKLELGNSESEIQNSELRKTVEPELNDSEPLIQNYPPSKATWLPVPGGISRIGYEGSGFCFDNELNPHEVLTADFEIQNRLVTNGEYLAFVAAGGYHDFRHWLGEGWDLVQSQGWEAPLYWVLKDKQWHRFTHRGLQPVNPTAPVTHISFYEAQAYATWVGARLLTEQEWEVAACHFQATPEGGTFLESNLLDPQPLPPNADPTRCHQLLGDAWEWTYSPYHPYPGYNRAPGALGEYNGKFMINQLVLRGGSCATPVSHIRLSYRNFFHADKRWQFTGIRLAR